MANRLNVQNIYASDSDTTAAVQVSGANVTLNGTANDLGTISAGTLGSGVVFPADHIIGYNSNTTESVSSISTSTTGVGTGLSVSITPISASSKIIVQASLCVGKDNNNAGVGYYIYRTSPSNTSSANSTSGDHKASGWNFSISSDTGIAGLPIFFEDTPANNSSTHTYEVYVISSTSMTTYLNRRGYDILWGGTSSITVFEVAQ